MHTFFIQTMLTIILFGQNKEKEDFNILPCYCKLHVFNKLYCHIHCKCWPEITATLTSNQI